eukprot:403360473
MRILITGQYPMTAFMKVILIYEILVVLMQQMQKLTFILKTKFRVKGQHRCYDQDVFPLLFGDSSDTSIDAMFLNPSTGDFIFGGYTGSRPFIGYFIDADGLYGTVWLNKYTSDNSGGSSMHSVFDLSYMQTTNQIYALIKSLPSSNPTYNLITSIERSEGKPIKTWQFEGIMINLVVKKSQILISEVDSRIIVSLRTLTKQYIAIMNADLSQILELKSPSVNSNIQFRCISNVRTSDQKFVTGGQLSSVQMVYVLFKTDGSNLQEFAINQFTESASDGIIRLLGKQSASIQYYYNKAIHMNQITDSFYFIGSMKLRTGSPYSQGFIYVTDSSYQCDSSWEEQDAGYSLNLISNFFTSKTTTFQFISSLGELQLNLPFSLTATNILQSIQKEWNYNSACSNIKQGKINNILIENLQQQFTCYVGERCLINVGRFILENCATEVQQNQAKFELVGDQSTDIAKIDAQAIQNYNYNVGLAKQPIILTNKGLCNTWLIYTLEYTNQLSFPNLITIEQETGYIQVEEFRNQAKGNYSIQLNLSYKNFNHPIYTNKIFEYILIVTESFVAIINNAPYFTTPLKSFIYETEKKYQYELPNTIDDEKDTITLTISFDKSQKFVQFDKIKKTFKIQPTTNDFGDFTIYITLTDNNKYDQKYSKYALKFSVIKAIDSVIKNSTNSQENLNQEQTVETNATNENNETVTVVQSSFISPYGIKIDNSEEKTIVRNKKFTEYITARIYKVSNTGHIQIQFDDVLKVPNQFKEKFQHAIDITLKQENYDQKLNFTIKDISSTEIFLQLDLSKIGNISISNEWDILSIIFKQNMYFINSDQSKILLPQLMIEKKIPPQLSQGARAYHFYGA